MPYALRVPDRVFNLLTSIYKLLMLLQVLSTGSTLLAKPANRANYALAARIVCTQPVAR